MNLKYTLVLGLVTLGVDALYLDGDVYLMKNPDPKMQSLAYGTLLSELPEIHAHGAPLGTTQAARCAADGRTDVVLGEHYHATCLNSGLFYARASAASVLWVLRYISWAQNWALGNEQNLF